MIKLKLFALFFLLAPAVFSADSAFFSKTKAISFVYSAHQSHVLDAAFYKTNFNNTRTHSLAGFYDRIILKRNAGFSADFKNGAAVSFINFDGFNNTRLILITQLGINFLLKNAPKYQLLLGAGFRSEGIIFNSSENSTTQGQEKEVVFNQNYYFFPNYYLYAKCNFKAMEKHFYLSLNYLPKSYRNVKEFDEYFVYNTVNGSKIVEQHLYFTERVQKLELQLGYYF